MADNPPTCGRGPLGTRNNCPEMDDGTSALTLHRANVFRGDEGGQVVLAQFQGVAPASRGASDAPLSESASLKIAIELFRASPESKEPNGQKVLATLDDLSAHGKITFADLPAGLEGQSHPKKGTIEMNRAAVNNPGHSTVWLVHEAYHLAGIGTKLYIDEEIGSRELQARYSLRLMQGVIYEGKTYKEKAGGSIVEYYQRNQIVDWVLNDYGEEEEDFLTQAWIAQHIRDWGGPANRTMNTRKKYIDKLLEKPRPEDYATGGRALFAILESTPSKEDARSLIKYAGGGDYSEGLKRLRERINLAMWGDSSTFKSVLDWQNRTGFDLGYRESAPKQ